mmetsp:Transcript_671/g.796  ORF Transcript_671/g.796 Transcript_671/m.796 type:complete len:217 (-) Transcript_671:123-773(-)
MARSLVAKVSKAQRVWASHKLAFGDILWYQGNNSRSVHRGSKCICAPRRWLPRNNLPAHREQVQVYRLLQRLTALPDLLPHGQQAPGGQPHTSEALDKALSAREGAVHIPDKVGELVPSSAGLSAELDFEAAFFEGTLNLRWEGHLDHPRQWLHLTQQLLVVLVLGIELQPDPIAIGKPPPWLEHAVNLGEQPLLVNGVAERANLIGSAEGLVGEG